jgi:hypothetical protein
MKNVLAILTMLLVFAGASSAEARRYEGRSDSWERSDARQAARERRADRGERAYKSKRAYRTKAYGTKSAYRATKSKKAYRAKRSYRSYASASYEAAPIRSARVRYGNNGRPRAWCGWWMRQQRGGGPEMNLAWNWSRWGRSSGPQVGAVVVWRHHVGEIVGRAANGQWLVRSGNDGGAVRTRARSVAGAVFRMG